jgi:serine/threonine-protein kinase HSL1 (negative regulator of Swe1 kinase)
MLQINPGERIACDQIWTHSFMRKYEYLDDCRGGRGPLSPHSNDCVRFFFRKADIDLELLSHFRSIWHRLTEDQLTDMLINGQ